MISLAGLIAMTAFQVPSKEYRFGYKVEQSLTYGETISVELNHTLTVADLAMAGSSATIKLAATSNLLVGDRVVFIITSDTTGTEDTITWGTNFTAPQATINSAKVKTFEFIYDGTEFKAIGTPYQLSYHDALMYDPWVPDIQNISTPGKIYCENQLCSDHNYPKDRVTFRRFDFC